jgi:NADPH2:quinone reductase
MAQLVKTAMGWNFAPGELGEQITREIVELVLEGRVKPVVGQVVAFESLPAAVESFANRETTGRTVVLVD